MRLVELTVTQPYIGAEGLMVPGGQIRVSEHRARYLVEKGLARVRPMPGPQETKPAAPAETKTPPKPPLFSRPVGWPLERHAVIQRAWAGKTCVVIGGGPSLDVAQVDACRRAGVRAIGVNDAYRLAPWVDILYFADSRWWQWHRERPEFQAIAAQLVTVENNRSDTNKETIAAQEAEIAAERIRLLRNYNNDLRSGVLSVKQDGVATGLNSGFQAINIAYLLGAARVLLLGFDMQKVAGKSHWFGEHPAETSEAHFSSFQHYFRKLAKHCPAGFEIVNCTPGGKLDCFPRLPLHEALARLVADPYAAALSA